MRLIRGARSETFGVMLGIGLLIAVSGTARAQQPSDPNPGNITLTTGMDFPTVYIFRGFVQEVDPSFTAQPYGDVGISFYSGSGALKSAGVNFGLWNSLQTGSSGSKGNSDKLWYEEDFYGTLNLGFGGGVTVGTTYIAYTSPNAMFANVREINFKVSSSANRFAPYGVLAFELTTPGPDGGPNKGTYLELGMGPTLPLATSRATFAIPIKLGLSLNDYYENLATGEDNKFGFFDIGALVTLPLGGIPSGYGSWNLHGGVDYLRFGDTTKLFNCDDSGCGDKSKVVGSVGLGLTY